MAQGSENTKIPPAESLEEFEQEQFFLLSLDMLCIFDAGGYFRRVNPAATHILGFTAEQLVGSFALDYLHPEDRAASEQAMQRIISGQPVRNFVNRIRCLDGSYKSIMWATAPAGNFFYAAGRDVTDRVETEARLHESENSLQSTLDALTSHIAVLDEFGTIIAANRAWREFAEKNEGTAISCEIGANYLQVCEWPLANSYEAAEAARGIRAVMEGRLPVFEMEYDCHSALEKRWFALSVTRFTGEGPMRVVVSHEDITGRRLTETALGESQLQVSGIVNAAMDAIITIDEAQCIVLFNPAAERMFGYECTSVLGQSIECVIPEKYRAAHADHVRTFAQTGMTSRKMGALGALNGLRADGEEFPIEASISQVNVAGQKLFTVILRDITERKIAETALTKRTQQQAAVAELGQLALASTDLQQLFDQAVEKVAFTLGTEFCKVLQLQPGGDTAKVVAGVGWKEGTVGNAVVGARIDSQVGFTLLSKRPIIVRDLRSEPRFKGMPLLHEHNIVSGITVIIGAVDKPYGAMGAHSTRHLKFAADDVNFFQSVANVLAEAIQRKQAEEKLQQSYEQLENRILERTAELNAANESLSLEIVDRKMALEALRETSEAYQSTEQMLQLVMNHIPQAIFWKDRNSTYLGCNDRLALDAGYDSAGAMLGKNDFDMPWAEHGHLYQADDREVMSTDTPKLNIEEPFVRADGSRTWLRTNKIPLHDQGGDVVGVLVSYEDITSQKEAETAIHQAREEAEAANLAKSEFLSRMSHELRTPLNAIIGFGQILEMRNLSGKEGLAVEHILKAGRHLLELINEILDVSRIEAGHMSISTEPIRVADIVAEALDLVKPLAAGRQIQMFNEIGPQIDWHVLADRQRLKQVLLNILSNAIKYNRESGRVTITGEIRTLKAMGELGVRLCINDTGRGLEPGDLGKLFTPFERLGAEQLGVEGTGIGLTLSKQLVQAMGGQMGVDSIPNEGSSFWVEFPLTASPVEQVKNLDIRLPVSNAVKRKCKILYIEDNLSNLILIEHVFRDDPSITLLSAMQGSIGLDLAHQHNPDLILLDLHLPDINGDEVLRRLHEEVDTRNIPVVVISADATSRQVDRLLAAGAKAYLTKPLNVPEFLQVVTELINEREG